MNAVETCNPDNKVNLLTDIGVEANNVDDSRILNDRLDTIEEKTPELEELHTDGAYGSKENDEKMEELGIRHVQTAMRGEERAVEMKIERVSEESKGEENTEQYRVSCPTQSVKSQKVKKRHAVRFDKVICDTCPYASICSAKEMKSKPLRVWYFNRSDYFVYQRRKSVGNIPKGRRKLRNNVEATMKDFKQDYFYGKLRTRGRFKTELFAYMMGIGINFGRIYRYMTDISGDIFCFFGIFWEKGFCDC